MTPRFAASLIALVSLVSAAGQPVAAQPKPSAIQPTAPVFKLVKSIGTSAEQTAIQTIVSRVKTRVETDAAFYKQIDDAYKARNSATVKSLFSPVAQLQIDQIWAAAPLSPTSAIDRPVLFRNTSYERFNPFAVLVLVGSHGLCFGTKTSCRAAFAGIGWTLDADE